MSVSRRLFMRRSNLSDLPPLAEPPPGYALRLLRPGEEAAQAAVLQKAFPEMEWSVEKARNSFTKARDVRATFVIAYQDVPVATASARFLPETYPDVGYLHWVGADPSHKGRGLGRLVSLRVLHYFRQEGCREAVLETDDFRLPAIKIYLALDFLPEYVDPTQPERWEQVMAALQRGG